MGILKIQNISKIYGENDTKIAAVNNISFEVEKGEFVAIIGSSRKRKIYTFTYDRRSR